MKAFVIVLALLLTSGQAWAQVCQTTSLGLTTAFYQRSQAQHDLGLLLASQVVPRDAAGHPDPNGLICVSMIGMSNSYRVWRVVQDLWAIEANTNPAVVLVNGAQGGVTAKEWADPSAKAWNKARSALVNAGCTEAQVQMVAVKVTELVENGPITAADLYAIAANAAARYPHLSFETLSGVNYMGYIRESEPIKKVMEPYAHQETLLMAAQVESLPVWGAFIDFWADGIVPHPQTGLTWVCKDYASDLVHPQTSGRQKMAAHYLNSLRADPVFAWMWNGAPSTAQTLTGTLALVSGECLFTSTKGTLTVPVSWCEG